MPESGRAGGGQHSAGGSSGHPGRHGEGDLLHRAAASDQPGGHEPQQRRGGECAHRHPFRQGLHGHLPAEERLHPRQRRVQQHQAELGRRGGGH